MSKCARKLAPRWGALMVLIYLVVMGIVRVGYGKMPATNAVQWTFNTGTIELPFTLPRLVDATLAFLVSTTVTWFLVDINTGSLARVFGFKNDEAFEQAAVCSNASSFWWALALLCGAGWHGLREERSSPS